ncbi:MAG: hypothetical protein WCI73_16510, partial [Phycisphaerae bacterium]
NLAYRLLHFNEPSMDEPMLLWLREWGIFNDDDVETLLQRFRLSFGENSPFYETPGHLFEPAEIDLAAAVWTLSFIGLWDVYLIPARGRYMVDLSHDEIVTVWCFNETMAKELKSNLSEIPDLKVELGVYT